MDKTQAARQALAQLVAMINALKSELAVIETGLRSLEAEVRAKALNDSDSYLLSIANSLESIIDG